MTKLIIALIISIMTVGCGVKRLVHTGPILIQYIDCPKSINGLLVTCTCHGPSVLAVDAHGNDVVMCSKTKE